jgi:hypothetical protein
MPNPPTPVSKSSNTARRHSITGISRLPWRKRSALRRHAAALRPGEDQPCVGWLERSGKACSSVAEEGSPGALAGK